MKLFDEMEKCFPEMEKHFKMQYYAQDWLSFWNVRSNRDRFFCWTIQRFIVEESELTELFHQAGVHDPAAMTSELINWFLYDLCSRDAVIRADIAPVQESMYRSLHLRL